MWWSRLTGLLLLALAGLCGVLGFSAMRDFAGLAGSLSDLALATLWWLLVAACVIAAYHDFRRADAA